MPCCTPPITSLHLPALPLCSWANEGMLGVRLRDLVRGEILYAMVMNMMVRRLFVCGAGMGRESAVAGREMLDTKQRQMARASWGGHPLPAAERAAAPPMQIDCPWLLSACPDLEQAQRLVVVHGEG